MAAENLERIQIRIAEDNPVRAVSFIVELTEHMQRLADLRLKHEVVEGTADVMRAVHGNYNMYYRFIGGDVLIVRVLLGKQTVAGIVMD